jgi:uncharacterized protein (DUF302 family)
LTPYENENLSLDERVVFPGLSTVARWNRAIASTGLFENWTAESEVRSELFESSRSGDKFALTKEIAMSAEQSVVGLHIVDTSLSVTDALDRLEAIAIAHGLTVFARIDFSADAARAGLPLPATETLLLGNAKAGTPLMAAQPTVAIDLPLRVLGWTDAAGKARLAFNDPEFLQKRHGFPSALIKNIAGLAALVAEAAQEDSAPAGITAAGVAQVTGAGERQ